MRFPTHQPTPCASHVPFFSIPPAPLPVSAQVAAIIQEEREERALRKAEMEAQKVLRGAGRRGASWPLRQGASGPPQEGMQLRAVSLQKLVP